MRQHILILLTSALASCQAPAPSSSIERMVIPPAAARPVQPPPSRPATTVDERLDEARKLIERGEQASRKREDRK